MKIYYHILGGISLIFGFIFYVLAYLIILELINQEIHYGMIAIVVLMIYFGSYFVYSFYCVSCKFDEKHITTLANFITFLLLLVLPIAIKTFFNIVDFEYQLFIHFVSALCALVFYKFNKTQLTKDKKQGFIFCKNP